MKKRLLSLFLAFVMTCSLLPAEVLAAETEIQVNDNVIDIADRTVYSLGKYYAKAVDIQITGATVESATEDGTTVNIVLDSNTASDEKIAVTFGTALNKCDMVGHTAEITLKDSNASVGMTLKGRYDSIDRMSGTVAYTLNFSVAEKITAPPTILVKSDTESTYAGVAIDLNLKDYFENATVFYLVEGEKKTPVDGKTYTFRTLEGGTHTLVFAASNGIGMCEEVVTVTVEVTEIESGAWLGITTSNGSVNYVLFTDKDGNPIDGLIASYEGTNIAVTLPRDYDVNSKITATFNLTQNGDGLPKLSTSNAFNGSNDTKVYNTTLSNGMGKATMYLYNAHPKATNNSYTTYTINYAIDNKAPTFAEGQTDTGVAEVVAGNAYTIDLGPIFADAEGDDLTYSVKINGEAAVVADKNYSFVPELGGTYELEFFAKDFMSTSVESYKVTLTVTNSTETYEMTVYVPDGLTPDFYVTSGFEDGIDKLGDALYSINGESTDGMTAYTVNYPVNADMISIRTENFGGLAFSAESDGTVSLRKTQLKVVDYDNNDAVSTNNVTYSGNTAVAGSDGWLLVVGNEYVFKAAPQNADLIAASKTLTMEAGTDIYTVSIMLGISNPMSITVPTGAKAQLYKYNEYYDNTELKVEIISENDDDTTTYQFVADTKANGASYIYRVSMEGKITKAGWLKWGEQNLAVNYTDNDKAPSYRLDDYSITGEKNSSITEDSVLLNVNSRNHLNMSVGQSKVLKGYRAWEIIAKSYQNYIITPDFHFNIISGDDVISLTEKPSLSTADGDWMTVKALKQGIAVIEVTYDAIEVKGGDYDGVYGASDPNRTGLLIVQVGENDDASVKFGIDSFASIGTSGSKNITYNPNNKKDWDSEFDTLYFLGNSGNLTLMPTASSEIIEVSVSHDKGATWINLAGEDGVYNAEIIQGNNIIKVKTASGTAYQVVRGDKVTVKFAEVEGKSNDNGIVEAGETIRVYLNGLHNPIPKMAGNYNPGYAGNYDGYSSQHLNYTCNEVPIYGNGAQYNFITTANCIEVVMPDDGKDVTLYDGYIGLGVIGLTEFVNGSDSHRNIPDDGCTTRGSSTTYHTRSILPDITVSVGDTSAPNNAPIVRKEAVSEKEIYNDQNFAINPDTLFVDADGDTMTFTVSVNGAEAVDAPLDYKFTPNSVGTYTLLFTATDGKETAQHTITLTVTNRPSQGGSQGTPDSDDEFGLSASEIAGYVTISFTDNGVRVKGESGLKYPKALGTIIKATKVPYKDGEKITHVTKRLLDHLGIRMEYTGTLESGFYLGAICNFELKGTPYDSFGEFDAGVGSGWMITHNDVFIEYGASEFEVADGDVIKWQYTCQLGADIGDPYFDSVGGTITPVKNAVDNVEELIDAIGDVTLDSKAAIEEARAAYDALTDSQKNLVENYNDLLNAESRYETLVKASEMPFADVENHWGIEAITYVYENEIMTGTSDTTFDPDTALSRGMLATVLYRLAGSPEVKGENPFPDVKADEWYTDAVIWAYENGIVKGYDNGDFGPGDNITREQMAVMLMNYAQFKGIDTSEKSDLSQFADAENTSAWAVEAVKWAVAEGLITGRDTGLMPKAEANRAETATVLMRFMEK